MQEIPTLQFGTKPISCNIHDDYFTHMLVIHFNEVNLWIINLFESAYCWGELQLLI